MSQHYSASQFDHAFKPIRLSVYTPFTNMPCPPHGVHAMCLPNRCSTTSIIADDKGKLLDCICRGPSSPWGDYATNIWEATTGCSCVPQYRNPEKCCPGTDRKSVYVGADKPKAKRCTQKPAPRTVTEEVVSRLTSRTKKSGAVNDGLTPQERRLQEQLEKKQKREQKKIAQLIKKEEIDLKAWLKREKLMDEILKPRKTVDLNAVRKQTIDVDSKRRKKKQGKGPECPPLNGCCSGDCNRFPGQPLTCPCLFEDNYIRRY